MSDSTAKPSDKKASLIQYVEPCMVYDNPAPHVHSRHGYHPGLAKLPNGDLIALFMRGEAFESPNGTTYVSRSNDSGNTWSVARPLYDKSGLLRESTDTMKPLVLRDGSLVATGYQFYRDDPEQGIAIPETAGFLSGDNIVTFSQDGGVSWQKPEIVPRSYPELLENSGPCIETVSGDLVGTAGFYKLPDGTNPTGQFGVVLRSRDKGKTWDNRTFFLPPGDITPWETRICEMQPGRLVAVIWAYDGKRDCHMTNRVTVSHDNGYTWSPLIDTGHMGQSSNLLWLGGQYLLSIHAHRGQDPGVYVRIVDFSNDRWNVVDEANIWGGAGQQTRTGQSMTQMFASLRFGQPSLLRLKTDEFLACHWSIEEGQGKIRAHRLHIRVDHLGLGELQ